MPDNSTIADNFSLLSKLMDIHGENSFKAKSFANAAFTVEKLSAPLQDMHTEEIAKIKGIGESISKSIQEMLQTEQWSLLDTYIEKTPSGILEMMKIKGLGPKKIASIWKDLEIESLGELLYACNENRLMLLKGFGQKTQDSVKQSIEFYFSNRNRFLFAEVEPLAIELEKEIQTLLAPALVSLTGQIRRQEIIIDEIELVADAAPELIQEKLSALSFIEETPNSLLFQHAQKVNVRVYPAAMDDFGKSLFLTTATPAFIESFFAAGGAASLTPGATEEQIFSQANLHYLPPCLRNDGRMLDAPQLPELITPQDIRGIIHSHSTWSDGQYSLEEMALAAKAQGFEYLVISDHSRSAFYANGLSIERIAEQHAQIDALNQQLAPFRIFKSIEADILNDGSLDYPDEILASFDLVIASIHSNLKMSEEKAMSRLLKAIENPYTTILGHMTGRLLLSRNGYPVDHRRIIDACAEHNVVIELNAHPRRLDIDWEWIPYAREKGVLLSIDPDAHSIAGYKDVYYGTLAARKGGLSADGNLSSYSKEALETYILNRKK
ncbi:DNA polymerase/3'-5' exonuclease PolX [Chitinophaga sancti]|uniref:DNA polymerase (Family 10) n=1 Tax=Chitinophaga sancti TaxID=1004 RepID=A0A1K1PQX9_9BACT|nr:DNA polymerase/3'-5' exonuclease PolX [Chitinophaga sancti]WQD61736.1 helix-hairpin-helix domain-containing protein [Chitinophaga sancti]WQG92706.1 helix-hairpin-helix domain-containing protein [Chitinophaga sancti]SFW50138.1 DNA polymerase (family 10) [Chitinophaga sancti]